jgi:hypothetical protein
MHRFNRRLHLPVARHLLRRRPLHLPSPSASTPTTKILIVT